MKEIDVRNWFYFPILMPLNKDGVGPAPYGEISKITFEVWDQHCDTYGSFECLFDAINESIHLNYAKDQING